MASQSQSSKFRHNANLACRFGGGGGNCDTI